MKRLSAHSPALSPAITIVPYLHVSFPIHEILVPVLGCFRTDNRCEAFSGIHTILDDLEVLAPIVWVVPTKAYGVEPFKPSVRKGSVLGSAALSGGLIGPLHLCVA